MTQTPEVSPTNRKGSWRWRLPISFLLIASLGYGTWWWSHPNLLDSAHAGLAADPLPVDDSAWSVLLLLSRSDSSPATVTINKLEAKFAVNSADAVVTYFVCHLDGESTPWAAGRIPTEICSDIDPFEPGMPFKLTNDPPTGDALYVTITPSRPGVARLTNVKVSYATGSEFWFRRGTQDLDIDMKVTAR